VEAKIWVTRAEAVSLAAVRTRSGLVVGEAVALALQPIKTMGMVNIAITNMVAFLFIVSPRKVGILHAPVYSCKKTLRVLVTSRINNVWRQVRRVYDTTVILPP
jgi:hypothetical protein